MDPLVVAIIAAVIAIGAVFYMRSAKTEASADSGLTFTQALGAGILGLGIMLVAMPWASGAIAALDFISSSDFAILSGAVYALGILALLGGLVLMIVKGSSEA
jgi:hypothetical protein